MTSVDDTHALVNSISTYYSWTSQAADNALALC